MAPVTVVVPIVMPPPLEPQAAAVVWITPPVCCRQNGPPASPLTVRFGVVSVPVKVGLASGATLAALSVAEPSVSVPVPAVIVLPFTVVGVMAPRVSEIAGVVVAVATDPDTPLAVVTDTEVTVPLPPLVGKVAKPPVVFTAIPSAVTTPVPVAVGVAMLDPLPT